MPVRWNPPVWFQKSYAIFLMEKGDKPLLDDSWIKAAHRCDIHIYAYVVRSSLKTRLRLSETPLKSTIAPKGMRFGAVLKNSVNAVKEAA